VGKPIEISGKLLARNTLLNFIGQAVPLLVGFEEGKSSKSEESIV